jgi:hypothetical protein
LSSLSTSKTSTEIVGGELDELDDDELEDVVDERSGGKVPKVMTERFAKLLKMPLDTAFFVTCSARFGFL